MRKIGMLIILVFLLTLALSACGGGKASDPAAKAVENYLNALVNKDSNQLSALSCADWESSALLELDSLQAVTAKLDNVTCKTAGASGTTSDVNCQGSIVATYNNENQTLDLSVRTYQVSQQGGEYLVCGYK
jgi:hypothetical protein